jgi:cytochrome c-type biogenesis protein CcmH/NrfF
MTQRPCDRSRPRQRPLGFVRSCGVPLLLALLLSATALSGQIPEGVEGRYRPHPEAETAVSRLLSPFCPGLMLEQCPVEASRVLRDSMHALALQGWNADAIEAWMLSNHGEQYRAVPRRSGAGLLAWIFPPLALLLGLGFVGLVLQRVTRGRSTGAEEATSAGVATMAEASPPLSPEEEARLKAAIQEMEFTEDPVY